MRFTLIKASWPGWEKKFDTLEEARLDLLSDICKGCLQGGRVDPPNQKDIHSLLGTPCGYEYWLEEE